MSHPQNVGETMLTHEQDFYNGFLDFGNVSLTLPSHSKVMTDF